MISNIDEFDAKRAGGEQTVPASEDGGSYLPDTASGASNSTATDKAADHADGDLHPETPEDGNNPGALPPSGGTTSGAG